MGHSRPSPSRSAREQTLAAVSTGDVRGTVLERVRREARTAVFGERRWVATHATALGVGRAAGCLGSERIAAAYRDRSCRIRAVRPDSTRKALKGSASLSRAATTASDIVLIRIGCMPDRLLVEIAVAPSVGVTGAHYRHGRSSLAS